MELGLKLGNCKQSKLVVLLGIFCLISLFSQCGDVKIDRRINDSDKVGNATLLVNTKVTALPLEIPVPKDNPITEAKVKLGRLLFFDPILSGNKDVACSTCHHPTSGYAETSQLSIGVNGVGFGKKRTFQEPNDIPLMKKNSPTVLNTAFNGIQTGHKYSPEDAPMFWDLRVSSLETQSLEPIKTLEEMRGHDFPQSDILQVVSKRLSEIPDYQNLFNAAFDEEVTIDSTYIAMAIATYERTLVTNNSRFDQYMRGDENAISTSEKEGFELFKSVGCINCHNGPMFSDYKIHVLSVPHNEQLKELDKGFEESNGFRTPSLRNLNLTGPYMHNGSLKDLTRVLEFYEDISGGRIRNADVPREDIDPLVHKIDIKVKDMSLIISFLNSLNDNNFDKTVPETVPSGLEVSGNIKI